MKRSLVALVALLTTASAIPPAAAGARSMMTVQGSATATLTVHAHVVRNCLVASLPVDFGNYDPLVANASQPLDATGGLGVICTKGVNPTVELDGGTNAQGAVRRMSSGTGFLTYELYADPARTTIWGAGTASTILTLTQSSTAGHMQAVIFARVPGGQNVTPGDYDDTVTATVLF